MKLRRLNFLLPLSAMWMLSACATAQMHTDAQLNEVGSGCGLEAGELMQDDSEKRLLFMLRSGSTPRQRNCVASWARRNHLHLAVLEGVTFQDH